METLAKKGILDWSESTFKLVHYYGNHGDKGTIILRPYYRVSFLSQISKTLQKYGRNYGVILWSAKTYPICFFDEKWFCPNIFGGSFLAKSNFKMRRCINSKFMSSIEMLA